MLSKEQILEAQKALDEHGNRSEAARSLGINRTTLNYRLSKAYPAMVDVLEVNDHADGLTLTGLSKHVSVRDAETGEVTNFWAKYHKVAKKDIDVEALIRKVNDMNPPKWDVKLADCVTRSGDLLPSFLFTDVHIALRTWASETGENFDLRIFKRIYTQAFDQLLARAPDAESAFLMLNGDVLHWDGNRAVTPRSQHVLDADGRTPLMMDYAFDFFSECCAKLLRKYPKIHITCLPGNHDETMAMVLRKFLKRLFQESGRVFVDDSDKPVAVKMFGNNTIFHTHGHIVNYKRMPSYCAAEYPREWGASDFRFGYSGHLHTCKVEDKGGILMYQLPTLTPPDGHGIGFARSQRYLMCHTFHRAGGMWRQDLVSPNMLS